MANLKKKFDLAMTYEIAMSPTNIDALQPILSEHSIEDFRNAGVDLSRLLAAAALCNNTAHIERCLQAGTVITSEVELAAHVAGEFEVYKSLVPAGLNLNRDFGHTGGPLTTAVEAGDKDWILYLLQHGADPNIPAISRNTSMHLAIRENLDQSILQLLVDHGADYTKSSLSRMAILSNNPSALEFLLQNGSDANASTAYAHHYGRDSCRLLHFAAMQGDLESVKLLLDYNADLRAEDFEGKTAFDKASSCGKSTVLRVLTQTAGFHGGS